MSNRLPSKNADLITGKIIQGDTCIGAEAKYHIQENKLHTGANHNISMAHFFTEAIKCRLCIDCLVKFFLG